MENYATRIKRQKEFWNSKPALCLQLAVYGFLLAVVLWVIWEAERALPIFREAANIDGVRNLQMMIVEKKLTGLFALGMFLRAAFKLVRTN